MMERVCVTGAGGFIGTHLVTFLKEKGYWVRGVDLKYPEFSTTDADEFKLLDLRWPTEAVRALSEGIDLVFQLAADMGGMGKISERESQAPIIWNNTMINCSMIQAARAWASRYLFSSSACAYPLHLQERTTDVIPLREDMIYPALPQHSYGWEKLHAEHLCRYYHESYGMETRVTRFHAVFGPMGTFEGGREKAPAALCRKVAVAKLTGDPRVEIWGDGEQVRSFMYVSDCVQGIYDLMLSDYHQPINLGDNRTVTINELVDIIADIAGIQVEKVHVEGPQGVRGRNADITLAKKVLGWEPQVSLEDGLRQLYDWVEPLVKEWWVKGEE
jgi:nucleoside-diphosphate-sugar epimerase